MNSTLPRRLALALAALAATAPSSASAADGYFLNGYGPRQKALGGAGAADQRDAMALSVNPAGFVGLERQFQQGLTAVIGDRGYWTNGLPAIVAPGNQISGRPLFPVPNVGYIQPIDDSSAWSIVSYANGGINTTYHWGHWRPPGGGPFGSGPAGIDLQQAFFSVGYARRFQTGIGRITLGFAPTVAVQMFNAQGLKRFSIYSSNPFEFSDMAYDWSYGGGVRAGALWEATDRLRVGVSASTPMWMSHLKKYAGLLPEYGSFDIPAQAQAGVAYDILPNVTLMADWRHVFYSAVPAYGNPGNPILFKSLGGPNGPGFDWTDTDSAALGAEWRYSPALALRAGYHYTSNALRTRSVAVNILAPVVLKHHASVGLGYAFTKNSVVDFAFAYAFKNSFTGIEWLPQIPGLLPIGGPNLRASITPWAQAMEFTIGYNYKWDKGDDSIIPTHF